VLENGTKCKIYFQNVACFSPRNLMYFHTTLKHHSTTFSPSKNHILYTAFPKTPLKNARKALKNGSTGASN
jgi:hypothetical protein